ncbi:hypothetical protein [Mycobacterium sp. Lab-001]|uniref:hypothetical protein n=1 Tax=Mycobacterium sp. Lab-001 TaxID=3410136 RepID=UPI003D1825F5
MAYADLGDGLGTVRFQQLDEGSGKTFDALNAKLAQYQQALQGLQTVCHEVKQACDVQHAADVEFAKSPSVQEIQRLADHARSLPQGEQRAHTVQDAAAAKKQHDEAKERHRQATEPTEGALDGVEMPALPSFGEGGSGGTNVPLPLVMPDLTPTPAPDPGTSLSGADDGGTALKPMLTGQPAMPPMTQQPMMAPPQMPQGGGAGGGYPAMPSMAGAGSPRDRKKDDGKDPLDGLKTDLSGAGADGAAAGVAAGAALDRGTTAHGMHTRADVSGINRPAVGGGAGQAPPSQPQQGGMMGGPMGSGAGGAGGGGKPKPRPDIKSADPKQHGHDSVRESVEGGLLGRDTAEEPKFGDDNRPPEWK